MLAQASRLNFSTRLFNMIVTNVPGPQFPLYVLGRELETVVPVAFLPEQHALALANFSYNGKMSFGLLGDFDAMEDIDVVQQGLVSALRELLDAAEAEHPRRRACARADRGDLSSGRRPRGATSDPRPGSRTAARRAGCSPPSSPTSVTSARSSTASRGAGWWSRTRSPPALGCPLEVLIVRKLGYPGHEEAAFGALGEEGVLVPETIARLGPRDPGYDVVQASVERKREEVDRADRGSFAGSAPGDRPPGRRRWSWTTGSRPDSRSQPRSRSSAATAPGA